MTATNIHQALERHWRLVPGNSLLPSETSPDEAAPIIRRDEREFQPSVRPGRMAEGIGRVTRAVGPADGRAGGV